MVSGLFSLSPGTRDHASDFDVFIAEECRTHLIAVLEHEVDAEFGPI